VKVLLEHHLRQDFDKLKQMGVSAFSIRNTSTGIVQSVREKVGSPSDQGFWLGDSSDRSHLERRLPT